MAGGIFDPAPTRKVVRKTTGIAWPCLVRATR